MSSHVILFLNDRSTGSQRTLEVYSTDSGMFYAIRESVSRSKLMGGTARDLAMGIRCLYREYTALVNKGDGSIWDPMSLTTNAIGDVAAPLLADAPWLAGSQSLAAGLIGNSDSTRSYTYAVTKCDGRYAFQCSHYANPIQDGTCISTAIQFCFSRNEAEMACRDWVDQQALDGWVPRPYGPAAELLSVIPLQLQGVGGDFAPVLL